MIFGQKMNILKLVIATIFTKRAFVRLLLVSPILYVVTCSYISGNRSDKFERINVGDTKAAVIAVFGEPTHIEPPNIIYPSYAYEKCQDPCVERLWYQNKLDLVAEAWEFEIDKDNRVISRYHWVSP
jgi:hypothetical protein